jgi:hypothetical protein
MEAKINANGAAPEILAIEIEVRCLIKNINKIRRRLDNCCLILFSINNFLAADSANRRI